MNRYGQAKNEICAKIPEIKSFLNKGLTKHQTFNVLKEQGGFNCSLAQFYRVVSKYIDLNSLNNQSIQPVFNSASEEESGQIDLEEYFREDPKEEKTDVSEEDVSVSSDVPKVSKFAPKNPNPNAPPQFIYDPSKVSADNW